MTHDWVSVDEALPPWLAQHGLRVSTEYRDDPVRVVPIVDDQGATYSIGFDPAVDGQITIRAARDSGASTATWMRTVRQDEVQSGLREAWSVIEGWIADSGHTRTPYLRESARDIRER